MKGGSEERRSERARVKLRVKGGVVKGGSEGRRAAEWRVKGDRVIGASEGRGGEGRERRLKASVVKSGEMKFEGRSAC
jgi:hypothetical protein